MSGINNRSLKRKLESEDSQRDTQMEPPQKRKKQIDGNKLKMKQFTAKTVEYFSSDPTSIKAEITKNIKFNYCPLHQQIPIATGHCGIEMIDDCHIPCIGSCANFPKSVMDGSAGFVKVECSSDDCKQLVRRVCATDTSAPECYITIEITNNQGVAVVPLRKLYFKRLAIRTFLRNMQPKTDNSRITVMETASVKLTDGCYLTLGGGSIKSPWLGAGLTCTGKKWPACIFIKKEMEENGDQLQFALHYTPQFPARVTVRLKDAYSQSSPFTVFDVNPAAGAAMTTNNTSNSGIVRSTNHSNSSRAQPVAMPIVQPSHFGGQFHNTSMRMQVGNSGAMPIPVHPPVPQQHHIVHPQLQSQVQSQVQSHVHPQVQVQIPPQISTHSAPSSTTSSTSAQSPNQVDPTSYIMPTQNVDNVGNTQFGMSGGMGTRQMASLNAQNANHEMMFKMGVSLAKTDSKSMNNFIQCWSSDMIRFQWHNVFGKEEALQLLETTLLLNTHRSFGQIISSMLINSHQFAKDVLFNTQYSTQSYKGCLLHMIASQNRKEFLSEIAVFIPEVFEYMCTIRNEQGKSAVMVASMGGDDLLHYIFSNLDRRLGRNRNLCAAVAQCLRHADKFGKTPFHSMVEFECVKSMKWVQQLMEEFGSAEIVKDCDWSRSCQIFRGSSAEHSSVYKLYHRYNDQIQRCFIPFTREMMDNHRSHCKARDMNLLLSGIHYLIRKQELGSVTSNEDDSFQSNQASPQQSSSASNLTPPLLRGGSGSHMLSFSQLTGSSSGGSSPPFMGDVVPDDAELIEPPMGNITPYPQSTLDWNNTNLATSAPRLTSHLTSQNNNVFANMPPPPPADMNMEAYTSALAHAVAFPSTL